MFRTTPAVAALAAVLFSATTGCSLLLPQKALKPVIRNPFPQLSRVAVAPFFNQSDESTLDGRQVALAYFAELQDTPGFEVVPVGVVEEAIIANHVDLSSPGEARRLAQLLGVDAVAVGSVTDFDPYYPPRVGLRVEWYAANPGYHEIPAGYGLPWSTPEEEFIPDALVYESQMALAKAQMRGLAPDCESGCHALPAPPDANAAGDEPIDEPVPAAGDNVLRAPGRADVRLAQAVEAPAAEPGPQLAAEPLPAPGADGKVAVPDATGASRAGASVGGDGVAGACGGPACAGSPSSAGPAPCVPNHGPVLSHTRIYRGDDDDVADALEGYASFRADDRFGGWKSYLDRSDDYIRFCCRMHISEMLSARGGSRKMQVVWRWPESR